MTRCATFLAILLCIPTAVLGMDEARFMTFPDISGDKIVFTYDDDLWLTNTQGAAPIRLTSHPGREYAARFSPDGKWIAFSGFSTECFTEARIGSLSWAATCKRWLRGK